MLGFKQVGPEHGLLPVNGTGGQLGVGACEEAAAARPMNPTRWEEREEDSGYVRPVETFNGTRLAVDSNYRQNGILDHSQHWSGFILHVQHGGQHRGQFLQSLEN